MKKIFDPTKPTFFNSSVSPLGATLSSVRENDDPALPISKSPHHPFEAATWHLFGAPLAEPNAQLFHILLFMADSKSKI